MRKTSHDALDHFVFLYICTACLRWRLLYIIKDVVVKDFKTAQPNEGLIPDQWKTTHL